jgi:hypothetical protein
MKLINQPVDGDKQKLKEFVDNVMTVFELINPNEHDLLTKSVSTKALEMLKANCRLGTLHRHGTV